MKPVTPPPIDPDGPQPADDAGHGAGHAGLPAAVLLSASFPGHAVSHALTLRGGGLLEALGTLLAGLAEIGATIEELAGAEHPTAGATLSCRLAEASEPALEMLVARLGRLGEVSLSTRLAGRPPGGR
jgi:hypothetical protein